jgi:hypothetical protein
MAAVLALAAGGGVGYAAASLPKNTVGSAQIKNGAVKGKDIKNNAVSGAKVQDSSLTGSDVEDGSLAGADVQDDGLTGADIDERTLSIPGRPGTVLLTGRDFVPRTAGVEWWTTSGGDLWLSSGADFVPAVVRVPSGATVTGAVVHVIDNGPGTVSAAISRFTPATNVNEDGVIRIIEGAAPGVRTITLPEAFPPVPGTQLLLHVYLPEGESYRVTGAEVSYTFDGPGQ